MIGKRRRRREAGSERSVEQRREPMNRSDVRKVVRFQYGLPLDTVGIARQQPDNIQRRFG